MIALDAHGKVIRTGDRVHRILSKQVIKKHTPNGRELDPLKTFKVKEILKNNGVRYRDEKVVDGAELIKE